MPISDWYDMMPDTITHEHVLTRDIYGKPLTYATAKTYRARVNGISRRVPSRTPGGQDVLSTISVWTPKISSLALDDRITLPDGSTPLMLSFDHVSDEAGDHHTKMMF